MANTVQINWHESLCFSTAQSLWTYCGANMAASNKTWWHLSCFLAGGLPVRSSCEHIFRVTWRWACSHQRSWAALEPCWDLPGPQLSLPGASLEVKVSYNPCSWHMHANAEASTHYVGMQAHAQVEYIEEYMCATINQYRGKEITLYVQIYAHSYIMIPL